MAGSGRLTRMSRPAARRIVSALMTCVLVIGCGSSSSTAIPSATPTSTATPAPPSTPTTEPSVAVAGPPTACISVAEPDCATAAAAAIAALSAADPAPIYLQVGPFSCREGERCAASLAARPEGDVVVEFGGVPAVAIHLTAGPDGSIATSRGETFGVVLPPASARLAGPGPIAYELGHCGLFSGIDVDGTWWDPVGQIDGDHPDSINAATGTLAFLDATHATFTSTNGFIVHLVRRIGPKHLPMCQ